MFQSLTLNEISGRTSNLVSIGTFVGYNFIKSKVKIINTRFWVSYSLRNLRYRKYLHRYLHNIFFLWTFHVQILTKLNILVRAVYLLYMWRTVLVSNILLCWYKLYYHETFFQKKIIITYEWWMMRHGPSRYRRFRLFHIILSTKV